MNDLIKAPELTTNAWLNTDERLSLKSLHGKVIAIYAFQMLCPGCVQYSMPQAKKVFNLFDTNDLAVLGLHTVFEHHAANTKEVLTAFLYENNIKFPVGIDMPSEEGSHLPQTMKSYTMQGTPTLILIDRKGYLRKHKFGHEDDLIVGAEIMKLLSER